MCVPNENVEREDGWWERYGEELHQQMMDGIDEERLDRINAERIERYVDSLGSPDMRLG